jgi:hypothetical protein
LKNEEVTMRVTFLPEILHYKRSLNL